MTFTDEIRGAEAGLANRIAGAWHSVADAYEKRRKFNATLRELQALSPRELDDLGLSRSDLPDIAYEAVYGK